MRRAVVAGCLASALILVTGCGSDGPSAVTPSTSEAAPPTTTTSTTLATTTTGRAPTSTTSSTRPPPAPTTSTRPSSSGSGSLAGVIVVVDPGHNGGNGSHTSAIAKQVNAGGFMKECNTTGTAGNDGYSEAQFNWETAGYVRSALQVAGATVVMTRDSNTGVGPCVDARGLTATSAHADLMISIHADGSAAGNHGFHVIHPTSIKGYTDATVAGSTKLATDVRDALVAQGWTTSTYIGRNGLDQRGDLGTLNRSSVPSVMVETGNMRNAADLAKLHSVAAKQSFAAAIVAAVRTYLG